MWSINSFDNLITFSYITSILFSIIYIVLYKELIHILIKTFWIFYQNLTLNQCPCTSSGGCFEDLVNNEQDIG